MLIEKTPIRLVLQVLYYTSCWHCQDQSFLWSLDAQLGKWHSPKLHNISRYDATMNGGPPCHIRDNFTHVQDSCWSMAARYLAASTHQHKSINQIRAGTQPAAPVHAAEQTRLHVLWKDQVRILAWTRMDDLMFWDDIDSQISQLSPPSASGSSSSTGAPCSTSHAAACAAGA